MDDALRESDLDGAGGVAGAELVGTTRIGIVETANPALAEKLRRATPHWMRHTYATHALQRGAGGVIGCDRSKRVNLQEKYDYPESAHDVHAKILGRATTGMSAFRRGTLHEDPGRRVQ